MQQDRIYIAGAGMTPFGRHPDRSVKSLAAQAVQEALEDAGCGPQVVEAAYFGNTAQGHFEGQHVIRGHVALLPLGLQGIPVHNVEAACATGSTAFHLAVQQLRAQAADVVIAVGAEKLNWPDKARMMSLFEGGLDVHERDAVLDRLAALGAGMQVPADAPVAPQRSRFMDVYAAFGRQLMQRHGLTQRQIAEVAAKNRAHAVHNPRAQFREPLDVDGVLAAPVIAWPLTLPMCSPVSDGAAALVLCSQAGLARLRPRAAPVRVRASVMRSATARSGDDLDAHITRLTARAAYEIAGMGPQDIDVAEVHDGTAIGEIIQYANLGFCAAQDAGLRAARGEFSLGGRMPVNPSGGLVCKGHPVAATGLGQLYELVAQLRGECGVRQVAGARIALQENGGGLWGVEEAAAHVGILELE